jgi:hypothetical protein
MNMTARRLTAIEKLARRICWLGWGGNTPNTTEADYWADIPQESRDGYIREADLLVINMQMLRKTAASAKILEAALKERAKRYGEAA